jgi:hypothetical protein
MIRCESAFHNGFAKDGIERTMKQVAPFLGCRTVINRTTEIEEAMKMQATKTKPRMEGTKISAR